MKKFLSILLATLLVLAMVAPAMADETPATTYTITITGEKGHTYEAYQIFAGDLAGNVLSNIVLGNGVTTNVLTVDGTTYADAAALAAALTDPKMAAFTDVVSANLASVAGTSTEVNGVYTISKLQPGYYFIKDKDGSAPAGEAYTKFMIKLVKDVSATPKTDKTTHEKKVYENVKSVENGKTGAAGNKYNDVADYCIGDNVPFALYSKVPNLEHFTTYQMLFHDKMSAGLTFNNDVTVSVGGTALAASEYEVITAPTDGCTFEVKIKQLVGKGYATGAEIRVDFTAKLNSNAVIGLNGNPNDSMLEFSNNPNVTTDTTKTPWDTVLVFTYELDVTKVDGAKKETTLADAEFVLKNAAGSFATVDANGKVTGWVASQDNATVLKSDSTGNFKVIGLDDGTYYLKETKAPAGYNLLTSEIKVEVVATTKNDQNYSGTPADALTALEIKVDGGSAVAGDVSTGIVSATVENNVGATLPETGGIGTTLFYLFGSLMTAGSALILIVRRRAESEEE